MGRAVFAAPMAVPWRIPAREGQGLGANGAFRMLRYRLGVSLLLAVLVAVLAHGLRFGAQHLPAAGHAASLFGTLGAGLALAALAAVYAAALRRRVAPASLGWKRALPAVLAVGGLGAYGFIELSEGHAPFAGGPAVVLAVALAAALVAGLFHVVSAMLATSGRALAALTPAPLSRGVRSVLCFDGYHLLKRCRLGGGAARGRAPPLGA